MAALIRYLKNCYDYDPWKGTSTNWTCRFVHGADVQPGEEVTLHYRGGMERDIRSYADLQRASQVQGEIEGEKPFFHIKTTFRNKKFLDPAQAGNVVDLPYFFHTRNSYTRKFDCIGYFHLNPAPDIEGYIDVDVGSKQGGAWPVYLSFEGKHEVYVEEEGQYGRKQLRLYANPWNTLSYTVMVHSSEVRKVDGVYMLMEHLTPYLEEGIGMIVSLATAKPISRSSTVVKLPLSFPYANYNVVDVDEGLFDPYWDYVAFRDEHLPPAGLWSRLCQEAISKTSFDSNSIANGLELFDLAMKIKSGRIFSDILSKGKIFEKSKDAWLAYRYSYSTTLSDIEELGDFIEDCSSTIVRSGDSVSTGTARMKIKISPPQSEIKKCIDALTRVGVAPNLYNLWDLVPFSFVADWFIGLGDVLESITQYGRVNAYDVHYVTTSWKWYHKYERQGVTARLEFYERNVSPTVPPYTPYVVQPGPSGSTQLKRAIDAVCLFS
jgi:hypothetical protein